MSFLGSPYSRYDVAFGYAWYSLLWGSTRYDARLRRMRVRLGALASLESEDESVKEVYGHVVRREHPEYVGFGRLQRRARGRLGAELEWIGTYSMPRNDPRAWLYAQGLLFAVRAYVGGAS